MHRTFLIIIGFLNCLLLIIVISASGDLSEDIDIKSSVVKIYNQNEKLIGTGTSISFSGLIFTSKHILEDKSESGPAAPNYLLKLLIGRAMSSELEKAELLSIHPFMDIAILIKRGGEAIPPIGIGKSRELKVGNDILIIGHRRRGNELYITKNAKVDEIDRDGHIILSRMVESGTSGGPCIYKNQLVGVIRSTAADKTKVVPIDGTLDYFQLMGIKFSEDGLAYESDDIAKLASKAELYEKIITDIQMDFNWKAVLKPISRTSNKTTLPDDISLTLEPLKKLSAQPDFEAKITILATPAFENNSFNSLTKEKIIGFTDTEWYLPKKGERVIFDNIKMEIQNLLRKYKDSNLTFLEEEFSELHVIATISAITGKGFVRQPADHKICFSFPISDNQQISGKAVRQIGHRCPRDQ
jgi:hypothetical protein